MKEPYEKPILISEQYSPQVFLTSCVNANRSAPALQTSGSVRCLTASACKCTITTSVQQSTKCKNDMGSLIKKTTAFSEKAVMDF